MPKLSVYKSVLEAARDRLAIADEELDRVRRLIDKIPSGMQRVELKDFPIEFARALLEEPKLKPTQRAVLALHIHGMRDGLPDREGVYALSVNSPIEFGSTLAMLGRSQHNVELKWNGRWYPVIVRSEFHEDENKLAKVVFAQVVISAGTWSQEISWQVEQSLFLNDRGETEPLSMLQVLEQFGLRRLQTPASEFNLRLLNAERMSANHGHQMWVKSSVLEIATRFWFSKTLSERPLGTQDVPRRAIVEAELGSGENNHYFGRSRTGDGMSRMPFVRLFSLDTKSYVFADIDDLETYEYDSTSLSKLCLPEKMKSVLAKLFATPTDQLFGDLVRGKHGGIVILASGNPGVGKTLTAEVYAEMTQRPLYVLEFGELGTSVEQIEHNLEAIFARVVRWNAVLQFDECEIFLSQRGDDLERSAIVGIFLRMLDYYEGLLFLTTNRPETLDYAIRSRVMLRLEYPDLDQASRSAIWKTMLDAAGLRLVGDALEELSQPVVNGRQIRNLVRLARILHPNGEITLDELLAILEYGCR